jgi:hypothetical protein
VYETRGAFDGVAGFERGTSVLVSGDERVVREGVLAALAAGGPPDDGLVVVATEGTASGTIEELAGADSVERSQLGALAVGEAGEPSPEVAVDSVASAADLTGMSLSTAKLIRELDGEDADRIRLGLVSVSTLLAEADLQAVFQFLHVFGSRVNGNDWLGLFTIDPSRHDQQTVSTVRAAFDAELRFEDGLELRGAGVVPE